MKKLLITAVLLLSASMMVSAGGWEQPLPSGAVQLGGYADVVWFNYGGAPSSFLLNHLVLDASAELYGGVLVRAEVEWAYDAQQDAIDDNLSYAYIDYRVLDAMTIRAGKFLIPFNAYNERLYRADVAKLAVPPITNLAASPLTDVRMADTGIQLRGLIDTGGEVGFDYAVYYVNGLNRDRDDATSAGMGGRLGVITPAGLEFGLSGYATEVVPGVDLDMIGVDACYKYETMEVRGEFVRQNLDGDSANGFYLQAAYGFNDRYEVVARFGESDYLQRGESIQSATLGGNYKITDDLTFRVAYEWNDLADGISTQLAVRF